jgi:hypothetical protein
MTPFLFSIKPKSSFNCNRGAQNTYFANEIVVSACVPDNGECFRKMEAEKSSVVDSNSKTDIPQLARYFDSVISTTKPIHDEYTHTIKKCFLHCCAFSHDERVCTDLSNDVATKKRGLESCYLLCYPRYR